MKPRAVQTTYVIDIDLDSRHTSSELTDIPC